MSGTRAKRIRRAVKAVVKRDVRGVWSELCELPTRRRARLAWRLLRARQGGAA